MREPLIVDNIHQGDEFANSPCPSFMGLDRSRPSAPRFDCNSSSAQGGDKDQ